MGGNPNPHGQTVQFKVLSKTGTSVVIEVHDEEEAEYLEVGVDYVAQVVRSAGGNPVGGDEH